MRNTIHIVSPGDYWPLVLAIRRSRMEWSLPNPENGNARARASSRTAAGVPCRRAEAPAGNRRRPGGPMFLASRDRDLGRSRPSSTHRNLGAPARRPLRPGRAVGRAAPAASEDDALEHLVRRYLGAFGPAYRIRSRGLGRPEGAKDCAEMLARAEATPFPRRAGPRAGRPSSGAAAASRSTPVPIRFLPTWDATLLVHGRATGILPEEYRPRIFHVSTPHSFSTFLVHGAVAGTWRYEEGRVQLDPFKRLGRSTLAELEEEGERLAAFHA